MRVTRRQLRRIIREEVRHATKGEIVLVKEFTSASREEENRMRDPEWVIASRPPELKAWAEDQNYDSGYRIQKGDTLTGIRDNWTPVGTTIDDIVRTTMECDHCRYKIEDPDKIEAGQDIRIPTKIMPYLTANGWVTVNDVTDLNTPGSGAAKEYTDSRGGQEERRAYGLFWPQHIGIASGW